MNTPKHIASALLDGDETAKDFLSRRGRVLPANYWYYLHNPYGRTEPPHIEVVQEVPEEGVEPGTEPGEVFAYVFSRHYGRNLYVARKNLFKTREEAIEQARAERNQ